MDKLSDLDIVQKCAEKMGIAVGDTQEYIHYDPLHDDAQAMALFKKFKLWEAIRDGSLNIDGDANRAICECIASMP